MSRIATSNALNLLPLGIPTLIIADDPQLIAAANTAYAYWSVEAPLSEPRIELRLEIANASPSANVCPDIRVEGSRLSLRQNGAEGTADAATLKGSAIVPAHLLQDVAAFAEFTDTLLLFLLARHGRTPVHASAFIFDHSAVVLAGSSGSGKSTLALAASERGFPLLSDDMIFVQAEPAFAVWGFPRSIHVFPADAPRGDHPLRMRNDKLKAVIPLVAPALKANSAALVVLERGKELAIRNLDPERAVENLMELDPGFDLLERDSRAAIELLASAGVWQLTLADNPRAAIDLLASRLGA